MVAEPRVWADVEMAVREWARDAVASLGRRIFFSYSSDAVFPQVALRRIPSPDDACLIQFDVWGDNKAQAAQYSSALATAIDGLSRFEYQNVILLGASVDSSGYIPDPENNKPRYIVQATFVAMGI